MKVIKHYYLDDEQQWLGYLSTSREHWVQEDTFEDLQLNLYRLNFDVTLREAPRRIF